MVNISESFGDRTYRVQVNQQTQKNGPALPALDGLTEDLDTVNFNNRYALKSLDRLTKTPLAQDINEHLAVRVRGAETASMKEQTMNQQTCLRLLTFLDKQVGFWRDCQLNAYNNIKIAFGVSATTAAVLEADDNFDLSELRVLMGSDDKSKWTLAEVFARVRALDRKVSGAEDLRLQNDALTKSILEKDESITKGEERIKTLEDELKTQNQAVLDAKARENELDLLLKASVEKSWHDAEVDRVESAARDVCSHIRQTLLDEKATAVKDANTTARQQANEVANAHEQLVNEYKGRVSGLGRTLNDLNNHNLCLISSNQSLEAKISGNQSAIDADKQRLQGELENQIKTSSTKIEHLEKKTENLETELADNIKSRDDFRKQFEHTAAELQQERQSWAQEKDNLENQIIDRNTLQSSLNELQSNTVPCLEGEKSRLEGVLESEKKRRRSLSDKLNSVRDALKSEKETTRSQHTEIETAKQLTTRAEEALTKTESKLDREKQASKKKQEKVQELGRTLHQANADKEMAQGDLQRSNAALTNANTAKLEILNLMLLSHGITRITDLEVVARNLVKLWNMDVVKPDKTLEVHPSALDWTLSLVRPCKSDMEPNIMGILLVAAGGSSDWNEVLRLLEIISAQQTSASAPQGLSPYWARFLVGALMVVGTKREVLQDNRELHMLAFLRTVELVLKLGVTVKHQSLKLLYNELMDRNPPPWNGVVVTALAAWFEAILDNPAEERRLTDHMEATDVPICPGVGQCIMTDVEQGFVAVYHWDELTWTILPSNLKNEWVPAPRYLRRNNTIESFQPTLPLLDLYQNFELTGFCPEKMEAYRQHFFEGAC
ncbi:hypothetical protein Slin15195_G127420 [Septoria linicola]|uniref:Uncharacterized protein n=1 Tax=Septoria linicola TaxID=215465 RepID=A0A9Q9B5M7_9PEZI|nr:hypothetical protein Slin14017_G083600 [Septoria linicola]USW59423.1 hypothetical protein Slin15195_G127420 [Septoria linicola]